MSLTVNEIARMMDISSVKADTDLATVRELAECAKRFNCICAYVLPCYMSELKTLLADAPDVLLGGAVGFPAGANSSTVKAAEARELLAAGAGELDLVMNVGMLRSARFEYVEDDIRAVIDAADGTLVKVIIEAHYLDDDQIKKASEICVHAGADFVKTGTGWAETGATLHNISLIKSAVGDDIAIKAAGGVRDLETLEEMHRRGATRFGVNVVAGANILEQCRAREGCVNTK